VAFETVQIRSTRNAVSPINGEREDLVAGDVIGLSLTSTVGITSVRWEIVGRPEGSTAGGAGPEPIFLATAPTASYTVDADSLPVRLDGSYIIQATINPGSPGEVRKTVLLARMAGITIPGLGGGIRTLRKLGGFESLEDTSIPTILQGWKTQLNRWLDLVQTISISGGVIETLAGAYASGTSTGDQTMAITDARGGGVVIDGSSGSFTGANAVLKVISAAGGPLVVDRASGNLGLGTLAPAEEIHVRSSTPGIRLDSSGGGGQAFAIENQTTTLAIVNRTSATTLATIPAAGGIQTSFGVGLGIAPPGANALAFGAGTSATISTTGNARIRYNETLHQFEASVHGNPYAAFGSSTIDFADGITTGSRQLSTLTPPLSGMYIVYVASRGDFFRLERTSTLTPVDGEIVAAVGGGNFLRMGVANPTWLSQLFWSVDPIGGDDENAGCSMVSQAAADAIPLKTIREANRRQIGSEIQGNVIWKIINSIPLSDSTYMNNVRGKNGLGTPVMIGRKIQVGSPYTVISWTPANPTTGGGGTGFILEATGIGNAINLNKLFESADGVKVSIIMASIDANHVRVLVRSDADPIAASLGTPQSFAPGDTIVVYDLPQVPMLMFPPDAAAFPLYGWLRPGSGHPKFDYTEFGSSSPFISRCIFEGGLYSGGDGGAFSSCLFTTAADDDTETHFTGCKEMFFQYCGTTSRNAHETAPTLIFAGCYAILQGSNGVPGAPGLHVENGGLLLEASSLAGFNTAVAAFNCEQAAAVIRVYPDSKAGFFSSRIYGNGNTCPMLNIYPGATVSATQSLINFGSTAHLAVVDGVNVDATGYGDPLTASAFNERLG